MEEEGRRPKGGSSRGERKKGALNKGKNSREHGIREREDRPSDLKSSKNLGTGGSVHATGGKQRAWG